MSRSRRRSRTSGSPAALRAAGAPSGSVFVLQHGLAFRVGAAASLATLAVMLAFALLLHHQMRSAIESWERRQTAALGHHLAEMLEEVPLPERIATLQRLSASLKQFGVSAKLTGAGSPPGAAAQIPLTGGPSLEVRTAGAGRKLTARLAPLCLGLTGGVLAALLLAVQGSVYWGLTRPLRAVQRQITHMRRGRWWIPAEDEGPAEIAVLSSGLEALGMELETSVSGWVEAERRAGFELARKRLLRASSGLRQEVGALVGELARTGALPGPSRRRLRRAAAELVAELSRPLEELGLGPPDWKGHGNVVVKGCEIASARQGGDT